MHVSRKFCGEIGGNYLYEALRLLCLSSPEAELLNDLLPEQSAGLTFALTRIAIVEQGLLGITILRVKCEEGTNVKGVE